MIIFTETVRTIKLSSLCLGDAFIHGAAPHLVMLQGNEHYSVVNLLTATTDVIRSDERVIPIDIRMELIPKIIVLSPSEKDWVSQGKKIQAIKEVRDRLGLPLAECKELVDAYCRQSGA